MGGFTSPTHLLIIAVIVLVLFGGGGKISGLMGDFAKGIKSFKKSMTEDEGEQAPKGDQAPAAHLGAPQNPGTQPGVSGQQDVRMAEDEPAKRS
ncbi:twin-arginine translocase TatA/TatE family subunit [Oecophyllibacter saccharovorans]|uniref:twin-arginine translocase TatA/TatE family subunit n=1 Tax=Oecophyllibacter saccharovorans TaxID=2558360 RepID=UPI001143E07D|nr:twin-arginine translocase TatA/TatE family subunit [Oecophyllibacter saccharovorans]QDH15275.1 twin-arginine translocase TatA/TatE family subunit [Oecophyllibacter saccharovorans]TPW36292.1 twin-arginine translocase TatA/TatE family subunit [Oecophyllibacter saccharovorans]